MKSKGFNTLRDCEGKGFLGCMLGIILIAAVIFVIVKMGPIYYSNYMFEEDLKTVISRAGARLTTNEQIVKNILDLARKNDINLTPKDVNKNIKIERFAGQIHINVQYFVPVNFLIMQKDLKFQIELSSFTAS